MFADDVIHLVLWLVKDLCLRDYSFTMSPKKRLVIGTRTSTDEVTRQFHSEENKEKKQQTKNTSQIYFWLG